MDSMPASVVIIGDSREPWLAVLEQAGWRCHRCYDLRAAQTLLIDIGPCIGVVDLSRDNFSLNGIANVVNRNKQVRWLALVRDEQLKSDTICQFIVSFCLDYFTLPIPDSQLLDTIGHQLGMLTLERQVWPDVGEHSDMGLQGKAATMKKLKEQVKQIAATDLPVLISGESGTGKDLVAQAIHNSSSRRKDAFISLDCTAMVTDNMRGYSAATKSNAPLFDMLASAHKGTLFLDEIAELSLSDQSCLARLLQQDEIEEVDASAERVDVRIIASTRADLSQLVDKGRFDQALYFKLKVLSVSVPALRERTADIDLLADYFLLKYARCYNSPAKSFSEEARHMLKQYAWPGNVRELINQVKRAVLLAEKACIDADLLDIPRPANEKQNLRRIREGSEREAILAVLEAHNGKIVAAAKELGVSRATMYRLLSKHDLDSAPKSFR